MGFQREAKLGALKIDANLEQAAGSYQQTGKYKEFAEQGAKIQRLVGDEARAKELTQVFEKQGYQGYLRNDAKYNEGIGDYSSAAADHAMLFEKDAAFAALERAFRARSGDFLTLKVNPSFDGIRSDPRFADLLHRIGLPQ